MNSRILNCIYILIALGALFGALFVRPPRVDEARVETRPDIGHIVVGDIRIPVSIADTPETRQQGLSGTFSLPRGTGKLFVFDTPGEYGFWMKDMQYPIDIVWIDVDMKVVGVAEAVQPESYPDLVYPPSPVSYVLELNAYEAAVDNVVVGTQLQLQK